VLKAKVRMSLVAEEFSNQLMHKNVVAILFVGADAEMKGIAAQSTVEFSGNEWAHVSEYIGASNQPNTKHTFVYTSIDTLVYWQKRTIG
jgi:hypothetical protein